MDQQAANASSSAPIDFIAELEWRGLLKDCTDLDGLRSHLADPVNNRRRAYAGFDPTADSLTIGNLVPIMMLVHFARAGHEPVVLMGGGTGLIGDPSGKSDERQLMTREMVAWNIKRQRPIFTNVFRGAGASFKDKRLCKPLVVNNADWLGKLSAIEMLRDVGKHFPIGAMLQRDSVRERLNNREQGISYTEFSYVILQSYDFTYLFEHDGITVQMGGSDQYGNIIAGKDLISRNARILGNELRRLEQKAAQRKKQSPDDNNEREKNVFLEKLNALFSGGVLPDKRLSAYIEGTRKHVLTGEGWNEALQGRNSYWIELAQGMWNSFGVTCPLVTKADGGKFGKSETGAIWLTAERTSPYAMYQFWLNTADEDVIPFLKKFTLLSREQIEAIEAAHLADPGKRAAQRTLATEATSIIHGCTKAQSARRAAEAVFSGKILKLPKKSIESLISELPSTEQHAAMLDNDGVSIVDLLINTKLAESKTKAREFLASKAIVVNERHVNQDKRLLRSDLIHGEFIVLRRGKKAWHLTRWK